MPLKAMQDHCMAFHDTVGHYSPLQAIAVTGFDFSHCMSVCGTADH